MYTETRTDGFTALEDGFAGYTVYDSNHEKIGKVDDLFMDANDRPEYIGVKMGLLGTHSTLIPFEMATVDEERKTIVLSTDKQTAKNGPYFDDDREITPEFENEVYSYYGLQRPSTIDRDRRSTELRHDRIHGVSNLNAIRAASESSLDSPRESQ